MMKSGHTILNLEDIIFFPCEHGINANANRVSKYIQIQRTIYPRISHLSPCIMVEVQIDGYNV